MRKAKLILVDTNSHGKDIMSKNACLFCDDIDFQTDFPAKVQSRYGYSEHGYYLLVRTRHSFAIVGYGAITPGYILLMPNAHYENLSQITGDEWQDFLFLKSIIHSHIRHVYGGVVFFEHGALGTCRVSSGACIDHAHLHSVPAFDVDLEDELADGLSETRIATMDALQTLPGNVDRYLFLENNSGEMCVYQSNKPVPSQFFRRIWAKANGKSEEYDFALFPEFANMRITYDNFKSWIA